MKYLLAILALVVMVSTASMADTGPAGGWGQFNSVATAISGSYGSYGYVYDPNGGQGIWRGGTDVGGPDGFTVTADIEMWMSMYFNATDIYFHLGQDLGPTPSVSASVAGWLSSNNGMYLFVTKAAGVVDEHAITTLEYKTDMFGRTSPAGTDIPVKWWITDSSGEHRMNWSPDGNGGLLQGMDWLLDAGSTGTHSFNIRCEINPEQYQMDGHYEMDPVLACSPVL